MNCHEPVPVIVETASGKLEGVQCGSVCVFKGIPFATARRWHAPAAVGAWPGVRSARQQGQIAPQNPSPLQAQIGAQMGTPGEDCLSLNVWTPACDGAMRPVMVWIHGGAFVTGTGSASLYGGQILAEHSDTVIVTINYRLGSFGFLRLADVSGGRSAATGSEGLLDQIAALEWVRKNISVFGGDAGNVTIFGESAGAMSVVALMASPQARGLFHKAICQSGGGHIAHTPAHANRIAEIFIRHTGLSIAELDAAPMDVLLQAQSLLLAEVDNHGDPHGLGRMAFQPTVDGEVLSHFPFEAIRAGSARGIPLIAGTTREEWKLWTALDPKIHAMDEDNLRRWAENFFGDDATRLLAASEGESIYERYVFMQTQRAFREPTERLLDAQSQSDAVFHYRFDWASPIMGGVFGACHGLEIGFVFGSHTLSGPDAFFGKGETPDAICSAMMASWTSFARDGVPRHGGSAWPQRRSGRADLMIFGGTAGAAVPERLEPDPVWRTLADSKIGVLKH